MEDTKIPDWLKEKIYQTMGYVSLCWSEPPKGVFDSTKVIEITEDLIKEIESWGITSW